MGASTPGSRVLPVLLLAALALVLYVASPFAEPLLLAAVLATTLGSLNRWLTRRLGGRPSLAASLLVAATFVAIIVPTAIFVTVLVQQTVAIAQTVVGILQNEGIDGLIARLPQSAQHLAHRLLSDTPEARGRLQNGIASASGIVAAVATGLLQRTGRMMLQLLATLLAMYLLLTRGDHLRTWLRGLSPLGPRRTEVLFGEMRVVSVSVFGSTIVTAAAQSIVALVGYEIARMPNAVLLTFLTFFCALVPALGATIFVLVVAAIELFAGQVSHGLILAAWGLVAVSITAQVLHPLFITRQGVNIDGGVMLFALLGGTAVFGPIGLLVGPLSVAILLALARMYQEERRARDPHPVAPLERHPSPGAGAGKSEGGGAGLDG